MALFFSSTELYEASLTTLKSLWDGEWAFTYRGQDVWWEKSKPALEKNWILINKIFKLNENV